MLTRAIAALLIVAITTPAFAEPITVDEGQPSPAGGVLLPDVDAMRAAERLRDAGALREEAKLLHADVAAKTAQIEALERALYQAKVIEQVYQRELALKDQIIEIRRAVNDDYRNLLGEARKTIEQNQAVIERLEKRIGSLESRMFWGQILGPLGFLAGIFLGGFHP